MQAGCSTSRAHTKNPIENGAQKSPEMRRPTVDPIGHTDARYFPGITTMSKAIKRAALYVRVSTDHQSVENQIRELRQVAERGCWQVTEV